MSYPSNIDASFDSLNIARRLIACKSVTPYNDGACEYIGSLLEQLGFKITYYPINEHGLQNNHIEGETTQNLFATLNINPDITGKHLLFAGHTDVVPTGSGWQFDPFEACIDSNRLYGRGAADMKGAIAAYIEAIYRVITTSNITCGQLSFLITGDEEGPAQYGTQAVLPLLAQQNIQFDACITGEPTNPDIIGEMIKVGRRGSCNFDLTIHGKQGHVGYPHLAHNAAHELSRILTILAEHNLDKATKFFDKSQLAVTNIDVPNEARNIIPGTAYGYFNIRFNDNFSGASLSEHVNAIITKHLNTNFTFNLEARISGESFLRPPDALLTSLQQAITDITGSEATLSTTGGTSDSRFIQQYCEVLDFGIIGKTMHQIDEYILIDDLRLLSAIYKKTIEQFL